MKKTRKPCLPPGWYPHDPEKIAGFLRKEAADCGLPSPPGSPRRPVIAAVAPHAGWYYSGAVAAKAAVSLTDGGAPDTVAVIGGHLPPGAPPLFALEDAVSTPLGELEIDAELRGTLKAALNGAEDRWADNTVEVLLPLVKYFFPDSKLLWLRLPADIASFQAGRALAAAAETLKRSVKVLASTDLTHYGANYGFSPQGYGRKALDWMKTVNDRRFIDAVLDGDASEALTRAERERSACSPGAVLGAMGFAAGPESMRENGAKSAGQVPSLQTAAVLDYGTSADVSLTGEGEPPDSFVGYAAICWRKPPQSAFL
jgi:AmmeMemoRadiSam system protein B